MMYQIYIAVNKALVSIIAMWLSPNSFLVLFYFLYKPPFWHFRISSENRNEAGDGEAVTSSTPFAATHLE